MALNYTFRTLKLPGGRKKLLASVEGDENGLLAGLVQIEGASFFAHIKKGLEEALEGRSGSFCGNIYEADFGECETVITDTLSERPLTQSFSTRDVLELLCAWKDRSEKTEAVF